MKGDKSFMNNRTKNQFGEKSNPISGVKQTDKESKEYYKTQVNKKISTPRTDSHQNIQKTLTIMECGTTLHGIVYDIDSLYDAMSILQANDIFKVISIPLHMYNADIRHDDTKGGTRVIGYIRSFDAAKKTLEVSIYANASYSAVLEAFKKPVIYCRCSVKNHKVSTILELVLCDYSRYEHLMPQY